MDFVLFIESFVVQNNRKTYHKTIYICTLIKNSAIKKILKYFTLFIGLVLLAIVILGGGFGAKSDLIINDGEALIFAHRGVSECHVENSVESFDIAREVGFNAIEADVNLTKDGKLIVFHDNEYHRLLKIYLPIDKLDWDEVKNKPLRFKKTPTKNRILLLDQFLDLQPDSVTIYLDLKKFSKVIANDLVSILEKYINTKKIIIADGNLLNLLYLKSKNPNFIIALEGFDKDKEWLYHIIPKNFKPDFYSSTLDDIDQNHMSFLLENNLLNKKIVYGVTHKNIAKVYELGIFNIIYDYNSETDDVETIKEQLAKNKYR